MKTAVHEAALAVPREVADVLAAWPVPVRAKAVALRALIFATAAATEGVGPLTERLKWGEPAYLTAATGSGSTIRLGWKPADPDRCALLFNCRTDLVDRFRSHFPGELACVGDRAVVFGDGEAVPEPAVAMCIAMALTYRRGKRRGAGPGRPPA